MSYVIKYHYPGIENNQPVGDVFVLAVPNLGDDVFSYTKDAAKATQYPTHDEAEKVRRHHFWPDSQVIERAA